MPGISAASNGQVFSGKVLETMDASGYTYMLLASNGNQLWVAIPETPVTKGAVVNYLEGMVMENFTSKTLNRTFDTIVFSGGLTDQPVSSSSPAQSPQGEAGEDSFEAAVNAERSATQPTAMTTTGGEVSGGSAGAIVPFAEISVEKSTAENGYTVETLFARGKELSGKKVQIRGQVVKFSPLIMGRNWVHLQDGTGDPMQNSHDLVITTADTVEIGDVVNFEGQLSVNKDFGAGYRYDVIVEQATLVKE